MDNDHWDIVAVQNRYGEACDRRDWALFDDVFTTDVVTVYGGPPVIGRDERVASIRSHLGGCGATQHLLGNHKIHVDGETAEASCYVRAFHLGAEGPDRRYEMFGIYHDRLRRGPDGWRITYRQLEVSFELGTRDVSGAGQMMEFGVVVPTHGAWGDPGMIRDGIQAAEELGYGTVWFGDHLVLPGYAAALMAPNWYDPLSCMLVGAGATSRIRLGSDVLVAPYRNPIVLSQLLAGADQLCDGRLTLGIGVGYVSGEFSALGAHYSDRGAVTDEYLRVMRKLWESTGPVSYEGRWINFDQVHAAPPPRQRPFPVWVGGNGVAGRRRAATLGTGWHPLFPTPEDYASGRDDILARREKAGLTGEFTFSVSTALVKVVLDGHPPAGFEGYAGQADIPEEFGYAPAPPVDSAGRMRFVGTPAEIASDIEDYGRAGVTQFTLRVWVGAEGFGVDEFVAELERFATQVRPLVS